MNKAEIRRQALAARRALPEAQRDEASRRITARLLESALLSRAGTVFAYHSTDDVVHTGALLAALRERGTTLLAPWFRKGEPMRAVRIDDPAALEPGPFGIVSPPAGPDYDGFVDVVIVPGVAFDAAGGRIGFGAGYYDRWLAGHAHGRRIALAYQAQVMDSVPLEAHDIAMDDLVTEDRWRVIAPDS